MKSRFWLAWGLVALLCSACDMGVKSARRFHLPQGNADKGKAAFVSLQCTACHTVKGVELPKPAVAPEAVVVLGGAVVRLRTYGDLLTAIVHPTYGDSEKSALRASIPRGKSPMPVVNDVMTVTEMVDLVTFLQPHYTQMPVPQDYSM